MRVRHVFIQRMKTKWGSSNPRAGTIRLNTELARKPLECLDYLVAHEVAHSTRQALNRLPVRHEDWGL